MVNQVWTAGGLLKTIVAPASGYTTDLLTDAKTYANHAGRPGTVETTDVEMAVQTRSGYEFTEGAPKDVSAV
jgi:histone H3/H4